MPVDSRFASLPYDLHTLRPLLIAIFLVVSGSALRLYSPHHRTSVENRVKAGTMSENEALWHRRFIRFWAPALTLLGLTQTGFMLYLILR